MHAHVAPLEQPHQELCAVFGSLPKSEAVRRQSNDVVLCSATQRGVASYLSSGTSPFAGQFAITTMIKSYLNVKTLLHLLTKVFKKIIFHWWGSG